jgi:hypothetical protein
MQLPSDDTGQGPDAATVLRNLDPSDFRATIAVADALRVSLDDEFDFGLELIIDALDRLQASETSGIRGKFAPNYRGFAYSPPRLRSN